MSLLNTIFEYCNYFNVFYNIPNNKLLQCVTFLSLLFWVNFKIAFVSLGNSVQQIGLSLPVIIIKQEESCQCQCACRDSVKDKRSKSASTVVSAPTQPHTSEPPPPPLSQPPEPPHNPATSSSSCCFPDSSTKASELRPGALCSSSAQTFSTVVNSTATTLPSSDGLANVDMSDFLSLQSPEAAANIEALLLVGEDYSMATDSNAYKSWLEFGIMCNFIAPTHPQASFSPTSVVILQWCLSFLI